MKNNKTQDLEKKIDLRTCNIYKYIYISCVYYFIPECWTDEKGNNDPKHLVESLQISEEHHYH